MFVVLKRKLELSCDRCSKAMDTRRFYLECMVELSNLLVKIVIMLKEGRLGVHVSLFCPTTQNLNHFVLFSLTGPRRLYR